MSFQGEQAENRVVHVVIAGHEFDIVPGAGLQKRRYGPLRERDVVVEGNRVGRLEVRVDAFARPPFHRLAERASRRPAEPTAVDAIPHRVIGEVQIHAPRAVRTQRANGLEVGRFLVRERRIGLEGIEFVVQGGEHRWIRVLVRKRFFDARLQRRYIAPLLAALHQFRPNHLPFQTVHRSIPLSPRRGVCRNWRGVGNASNEYCGRCIHVREP